MRKSNKKGFTVVELVIVIAVIAILAAVLIPTFAGLIQKANESKDTQLVKNLNTALAVDGNNHPTMQLALKAATTSARSTRALRATRSFGTAKTMFSATSRAAMSSTFPRLTSRAAASPLITSSGRYMTARTATPFLHMTARPTLYTGRAKMLRV